MDIDGLFISSYDGCHIMFTPFIDQDFISKLLRNTKLICDIFLEYVSAHVWLNVFWIIKRMHHSILYIWWSMTWRKLDSKMIILNFENYADGLQSYITQF